MFIKLSTVLSLVALYVATPSPIRHRHVIHEEQVVSRRDWMKGERLEKTAIVPMKIGLAQSNLHLGDNYLMDIADSESPNYGKHWSSERVHNAFAPKEETAASVMQWLSDSGIERSRIMTYENKGWLAVDVTVQEIEDLLKAEFHEHIHSTTSKVRVGTDKYHIPEHLVSCIDYIVPGIKLSPLVPRTFKRATMHATKSSRAYMHESAAAEEDVRRISLSSTADLPSALRNCSNQLTPDCIRALYSIPARSRAVPGNSLGLYQQGDYFVKSDVNLFFANYAPYVPQNTFPVGASIDGASYSVANGSALNGGEAKIDITVATPLIYPQTVTLYQIDDDIYAPGEIYTANLFNTFLDAIDGSYCNYTSDGITGDSPTIDPIYPHDVPGGYKGQRQCGIYKPTKVISVSYGEAEADLPAPYVRRQCNEFLKLGLQGISILITSGDNGVASHMGDPSASGCLGPKENIFNPQYPCGCPYVTCVGGTQIRTNGTVYDCEVALQTPLRSLANYSSAGGFSNYFPRPKYQDDHVKTYFRETSLEYSYYEALNTDVNTTIGLYNRIGRAYPDVSASGRYFVNYLNGKFFRPSGTSISAPLFASVVTLLNQERALIGNGSIGFLNSVLYRHANVLNDITEGNDPGCGSPGFSAVEGWDPVTGLGTPNYPRMRALFLSLP